MVSRRNFVKTAASIGFGSTLWGVESKRKDLEAQEKAQRIERRRERESHDLHSEKRKWIRHFADELQAKAKKHRFLAGFVPNAEELAEFNFDLGGNGKERFSAMEMAELAAVAKSHGIHPADVIAGYASLGNPWVVYELRGRKFRKNPGVLERMRKTAFHDLSEREKGFLLSEHTVPENSNTPGHPHAHSQVISAVKKFASNKRSFGLKTFVKTHPALSWMLGNEYGQLDRNTMYSSSELRKMWVESFVYAMRAAAKASRVLRKRPVPNLEELASFNYDLDKGGEGRLSVEEMAAVATAAEKADAHPMQLLHALSCGALEPQALVNGAWGNHPGVVQRAEFIARSVVNKLNASKANRSPGFDWKRTCRAREYMERNYAPLLRSPFRYVNLAEEKALEGRRRISRFQGYLQHLPW